jgi:hypothetical protein
MRRFLSSSRYIDAPFDVVAAILAQDAVGILQEASESSAGEAHAAHAHLRAHVAGEDVARDVRIAVGPFEPLGITRVRVPLHWEASRTPALFPVADAHVDVQALSLHPPVTEVELTAAYEPPLGLLGALGDAVLGHRLAEEAVTRFVRDVCARLEVEVAARAATASPDAIVIPDEAAHVER